MRRLDGFYDNKNRTRFQVWSMYVLFLCLWFTAPCSCLELSRFRKSDGLSLGTQQTDGRFRDSISSPLSSSGDVDENKVDKFLLRLTSTLAQRVRDKLEKEHTLSPTEVKLLEFFVKQIKQHKQISRKEEVKSKDELHDNQKNVMETTTSNKFQNHEEYDGRTPQNHPTNTTINTDPVKPSTNRRLADRFLSKLAASLAKRVRQNLDQGDHFLSSEEIKILELFIDQMKAKNYQQQQDSHQYKQNLATREQKKSNYQDIEKHNARKNNSGKNQSEKIAETESLLENIDKEISELMNELPETEQHTFTQYHPNPIAVDPFPLKEKSNTIQSKSKESTDVEFVLYKANEDLISRMTKRNTSDVSSSSTHSVVQQNGKPSEKTSKFVDDERISNVLVNGVVKKTVEKVAKDYVKSMATYTEKLDSKTDAVHENILNAILSFVTKRRRNNPNEESHNTVDESNNSINGGFVTGTDNWRKMKDMELRDRNFALKFWKKLGLNNVEDEVEHIEEEAVVKPSSFSTKSKKAMHCFHRPVKDCRDVCLDTTDCHRICLDKTKVDCITI